MGGVCLLDEVGGLVVAAWFDAKEMHPDTELLGLLDTHAEVFITGADGRILGAGNNPPAMSDIPAKELFIVDPVPLGRVEISVAAIVAPGLKVRAGGGFNMPGTQRFTVSASYLIGAR